MDHTFKEIQASEEDLDETTQDPNNDEDQSSMQAANDGATQVHTKK